MAKVTKHGGATNALVTHPQSVASGQAAPGPEPEAAPDDDTVYDGLTVEELRAELRDRGLATSGNKAELVDRLLDDDTKPEETSDGDG